MQSRGAERRELAKLLTELTASPEELRNLASVVDLPTAEVDWVGPMSLVAQRMVEAADVHRRIGPLCEELLRREGWAAFRERVLAWWESWSSLPPSLDRPARGTLTLDPGIVPLPATVSPSILLLARHGVVPFTGREQELMELDAWAKSKHRLRLRLIYGEGGAGKTRLAIEWLRRRREERGEIAGFLPDLSEESRAHLLEAEGATVAIDYAESDPGLASLLDALAKGGAKGRLRILMLARQPGDWLLALKERSPEVGRLLTELRYLQPLCGPTAEAREAEYLRALPRFIEQVDAHGLPIEDPARRSSTAKPAFTERRYMRVLYLHIAALAKSMGLPLSLKAYGLLKEILSHEARLWTRRADVDGAPSEKRRDFVEQASMALAMVTERGAMSRRRFELLCEERIPDPTLRRKLGRLFLDLYPAGTGRIGPLEPDLLGEALVLEAYQRGLL